MQPKPQSRAIILISLVSSTNIHALVTAWLVILMSSCDALKERMATKIDSSEGSFMAELEGMETKRLEASTDYAGKLEDR